MRASGEDQFKKSSDILNIKTKTKSGGKNAKSKSKDKKKVKGKAKKQEVNYDVSDASDIPEENTNS